MRENAALATEHPLHEELLRASCKLKAFIKTRTANSCDADDIYQETIARVLCQGQTATIRSPFAYALTVARTLLFSHRRPEETSFDELAQTLVSAEPLPDQIIFDNQRLRALQKILAAMPRLRREVLIRRRLLGQSRNEIAVEMEMSIEAVKKHLSRGIAQLHMSMIERHCLQNSDTKR